MNTTTKPTSTGLPKSGGASASGEVTEKGTEQAKMAYAHMGAQTAETAETIKQSCASALKSAQEYNNKLMEFAHANTNATFEFLQKLWDVKSPAAFVELSTEHAKKHIEALTAQGKELAAVARKTTQAAAEPIKSSVEKTFNRAG